MSETNEKPVPEPVLLAPADHFDPVIEAYKKDVDRTLLRENLKLTADERFRKFESFMRSVYEMREAGRKMRLAEKKHGTELS